MRLPNAWVARRTRGLQTVDQPMAPHPHRDALQIEHISTQRQTTGNSSLPHQQKKHSPPLHAEANVYIMSLITVLLDDALFHKDLLHDLHTTFHLLNAV